MATMSFGSNRSKRETVLKMATKNNTNGNEPVTKEQDEKKELSWSNKLEAAGFDTDKRPDINAHHLNGLLHVAGYILTEIKTVRSIDQIDMAAAIGAYYDPTNVVLGHIDTGNYWCQKLHIDIRVKFDTKAWTESKGYIINQSAIDKVRKKARFAISNRVHRPQVHVKVFQTSDWDGAQVIRIELSNPNSLSERE